MGLAIKHNAAFVFNEHICNSCGVCPEEWRCWVTHLRFLKRIWSFLSVSDSERELQSVCCFNLHSLVSYFV